MVERRLVVEKPQVEETSPGRSRRFSRGLKGIFDSQMRATVVGGLVLFGLLTVYHNWTQPPGTGTVTSLMEEEATASETHDTALVSRIYTADAEVTDTGCETAKTLSQTWQGYAQIEDRYRLLPRFVWLQHAFEQVTWYPNDRSASTASATAVTVGVLALPGTRNFLSITGDELWTFARVNGQWRVASFTYNLCPAPTLGG